MNTRFFTTERAYISQENGIRIHAPIVLINKDMCNAMYLVREMKLNLLPLRLVAVHNMLYICIYLQGSYFAFLSSFFFTMGHKILNRISRILLQPQNCKEPVLETSVACTNSHSPASKKQRWNTISKKAKQLKRQSLQVQAWFTVSYDNEHFNDEKVEITTPFNDEKTEIIAPPESIHSCLSSQSGFQQQPVSFAFSSPILTPQYTPRTSVDIDSLRIREDERLKSIKPSSIGLARLVNDILGDAIIIADQESEREFEQLLESYSS
jgi:hypothetical protein